MNTKEIVKSKGKDKNKWRKHRIPSLYACGNYERPDLEHLENLDSCRFSFNPC